MKVIILGHKGMLGHIVKKYFELCGEEIVTTDHRWPSKEFRDFIENQSDSILINCIGQIPQKDKNPEKLFLNNYALPIYLSYKFNGKIVHATTDCEFKGVQDKAFLYSKNCISNAEDDYGRSKALATLAIINNPKVKIIRTSIIGPELNSKKSLWEWFINSQGEVNGYTDHIWNGITTLQWAKICRNFCLDKYSYNLLQVGCSPISKFEILNTLNEEFKLNKKINPYPSDTVNKSLKSDLIIPSIKDQIKEFNLWQKNYC